VDTTPVDCSEVRLFSAGTSQALFPSLECWLILGAVLLSLSLSLCLSVVFVFPFLPDSLAKVCLDLQADHVPLFIPCPNKRAGVGITLDKFIPSPRCTSGIYLAMFTFVGKLMGVAIRTSNALELDLPSIVWKPLVGQELEVADLTAIDQICASAMAQLLDDKTLEEKGINADNFEDVYGLDFTYPSADGTLVELVENGADRAVTSVVHCTRTRTRRFRVSCSCFFSPSRVLLECALQACSLFERGSPSARIYIRTPQQRKQTAYSRFRCASFASAR
jgi:hypothetical protein